MKWTTKPLLYLFIIVLLAYGTVITILYYNSAPPQPVVKKSRGVRGVNIAFVEALEKGEHPEVQENKAKKRPSRINRAYVDSLEADEQPEAQENSTTFLPQRRYNVDDFDNDGLRIDAYGPGIHMNRYGQPVTLRPDFGGVPGEQLQIQPDAYGPGIHMDQYGRPVREYPLP